MRDIVIREPLRTPVGRRAIAEHQIIPCPAGRNACKELHALVGQDNVTGLPGFGFADGDRTRVQVEVRHGKRGNLTIAGACL